MIALDTIEENGLESLSPRAAKPFLPELLKCKQSFVRKPKLNGLSPEQYDVLEQLQETCASLLQEALQGLGASPLAVTALSPRDIPGNEAGIVELPAGALFSFTTIKESALVLLRLDQTLALMLVDCLLGGTGEPVEAPRPLTVLETHILADSLPVLLTSFSRAWARLAVFTPQLRSIAPGLSSPPEGESNWALLLPFSVRLSGGEGALDFLLPQPACEELLSSLRLSRWSAEQMAAKAAIQTDILRTLNDVNLPLRAIFGKARLSLSELARMNVGDIICLDEQESDELLLYAGDKETLRAKMITLGGRLAAQVAEAIRPGGL